MKVKAATAIAAMLFVWVRAAGQSSAPIPGESLPAPAPARAAGEATHSKRAAAGGGAGDSFTTAIAGSEYKLQVGDVIEVRVFDEDALNARARISQDGTVLLPLLGAVKVVGVSIEDARRRVQDMLGADYLVNPQVLLSVSEFSKRRFTVMGEVQQPGVYEMPEDVKIGLLQAISMAGGFTRLANPSRITLTRFVGRQEVVRTLDGRAMARGRTSSTEEILPGDTLYVSERLF